MEITFLPLEQSHLNEVLAIEGLSFSKPWTKWNFEREIKLPLSTFLVAKQDGVIIGYGGFWTIIDEAHIVNLAVHPGSRSKGVGRAILLHLLDRIRSAGIKRVLLEVRQSNFYAIKLYRTCGFKITGTRPRYYENEDAFVMEREQDADRAAEDEKNYDRRGHEN